ARFRYHVGLHAGNSTGAGADARVLPFENQRLRDVTKERPQAKKAPLGSFAGLGLDSGTFLMYRRRGAAKRMHFSPPRRAYWFAGLSTSSIPDAHPHSTPSIRGVLCSATQVRRVYTDR